MADRLSRLSERATSVFTRIPCYTDLVANLTIAVDDDLLHRARVRAAEAGISVNAVLRDELERFAGGQGEDPADAFLALARRYAGTVDDWSRDELHLARFEDE